MPETTNNHHDERRSYLKELEAKSDELGGEDRVKKQHTNGKYTARERIERLLDPGTFLEFDKFVVHRCDNFGMSKKKFLGDGVVTGVGKLNGQDVAIYSQDFTCFGGALGFSHAKKICKVMDFALKNKFPIIGISDSGGARIQEGVKSLAGYADIFYRNVLSSGVIPQISLILGPCAGGAVYSPAMTDFIFMVDKISHMFITGPDVIKTVTHEQVTKDELGGAHTHNEKSGVAHFYCDDEEDCFERVRELFSFLPASNESQITSKETVDPISRSNEKLKYFIPESSKKSYDMKELICEIVDDKQFLEVQKNYAQNIICGFASIGGIKIAIVANQPLMLSGVLDINSSTKAARFVRFADAFRIPILTLVDVPGFLPGTSQEHHGIIRHGAKLLYAFSEATVPLVTLITRKAYGGAYDVMASKHIGADVNLAYPSAEIAVMGAEGATNIIFRNELGKLPSESEREEKRNELIDNYTKEFYNPYRAAELGFLDEVIFPEDTRQKVYHFFRLLKNKKVPRPNRKHGNIPL